MADFQLNVLGAFELRRSGSVVRLPTRKAEALLTYLALARHRGCARDTLAALLWPEGAEQSARASLRQTLFLLGKALDRSVITTEGRTVAFLPDALEVDVTEFERCSAAAATEALERASELYRGDLLSGIDVDESPFEDWLLPERERLRERAIDVLARLVARHREYGAHERAIQAALRLVALDPLQEPAHRSLIELYIAAGRRAAALRQYEACATILRRELGAEPEAETKQIYDAILQRQPAFENVCALVIDTKFPQNLPLQRTGLIGREREVAEVCRLLERNDAALVTITGAGGMGKTRLGLEVMSQLRKSFAREVVFVDLAPLSEPALVLRAIAQALDVREVTRENLLQTIVSHINEHPILLMLDNFEHVIEAAPQLAILLSRCAHLKVLVTSRTSLRIYGERDYVLEPLATPDGQYFPDIPQLRSVAAIELFEKRAVEVKPDFEITAQNAAAAVAICRRLDGVPLAIELAAARVKVLPPEKMLARMSSAPGEDGDRIRHSSPLRLLTGGACDLPARQQTIRATIAWSYDLLDARERAFFRSICVFVGGFTLEAAEAVAGEDAVDILSSLLDKHLVQHASIEHRFTLFETVREFGLEQLQASGDATQLRRRHAEWYAALADAVEPVIRDGPGGPAQMETLLLDYENLRGALAWSISAAEQDRMVAGSAMRLAGSLWWFWYVRGDLREGRTWLERALRAGDPHLGDNDLRALRLRAKLFVGAAHLAEQQGDIACASDLAREALRLTRASGDKSLLGYALRTAAGVAVYQRQYETALLQLTESLQLCQEVDDRHGTRLTYIRLGHATFAQGQIERAQSFYERRLELSRADGHGVPTVLSFLGAVKIAKGDYRAGEDLSCESLRLTPKFGTSILSVVTALSNLARVARHSGETEREARLLGAIDRFRLNIGMTEFVPGRIDDDCVQALRTSLGHSLFESAFRDGQHMSHEHMIEYAIDRKERQLPAADRSVPLQRYQKKHKNSVHRSH